MEESKAILDKYPHRLPLKTFMILIGVRSYAKKLEEFFSFLCPFELCVGLSIRNDRNDAECLYGFAAEQVIVERAASSHQVPAIDKQKFLVPDDISVAQFMWIIRRRIALSPERALFVFVGRVMPQTSTNMGELYAQYKDPDGFLYLTYSGENTFGSTPGTRR
ncbi:gamma-aminobutyric acid receptor-associated protein 2-like [Tropilaelaps mercedesae]|uniref:Gamma-aminobutyric acid receptor-associated protein 2-like n=1 Tax=Tropilaelaps mercedesae TaxID=418985 RepID=A0A1V9X3Q2_9ACAR|nr:gamma-aminobutyric acid receptor-associated protein 2-like [Tropilaelaps mercedesae]